MSENARVQRWSLAATRDGNTMTLRGAVHDESELFVVDFMNACAEGLRANGYDVDVKLQYEATVRV